MKTKLLSVAASVEDYITRYFQNFATGFSPEIFLEFPEMLITDEVISLTLRGGKRLRAALVVCGYELFKDDALSNSSVLKAASAIELLQTYFLIHDDIMDEDVSRRGGKAVHCSLHDQTGSIKTGRDLAILAGDLANGMATSLMSEPIPASECDICMDRARRLFLRMHLEVISGQVMDLLNDDPAETVVRKTASYTVVGPLCIGALLGGADDSTLKIIASAGRDLGIAFQYRDDLMGLFGDPVKTGKPFGGDLKNYKNTYLLNKAMTNTTNEQQSILDMVLGNSDATDEQIKRALDVIVSTGGKLACENKISQLATSAMQTVELLSKQNEGMQFFKWLASKLTDRDS